MRLRVCFHLALFFCFFFFFNDTATTEIYTLSLHDALPIYTHASTCCNMRDWCGCVGRLPAGTSYFQIDRRSEEHTSELQSRPHLVCRLLLEKKKAQNPRLAQVRQLVEQL